MKVLPGVLVAFSIKAVATAMLYVAMATRGASAAKVGLLILVLPSIG
jgi:hypothetical protein